MSLRYDLQPRWILDASALLMPACTKNITADLEGMREERTLNPDFNEADTFTGPLDRPFILLPPCWGELRDGLEVLEGVDANWAVRIKKALELAQDLVFAGMMTAEQDDYPEDFGKSLEQRKFLWVKRVKDALGAEGKRVIFITANPMFLIRACINSINTCTPRKYLGGDFTLDDWQIWTPEGRGPCENVIIVDEKFFASNDGIRLFYEFPIYFGRLNQMFLLFLTTEVQEFLQSNQCNQAASYEYPFTYNDPKKWCPRSKESTPCSLAKSDRKYVNHEGERDSILARSVHFQEYRGGYCIGEPLRLNDSGSDGIGLEQVPVASNIFVVSCDKVWSSDICSKVQSCRPECVPIVVPMDGAFEYFEWKRHEVDVPSDDLEDDFSDEDLEEGLADSSGSSIEEKARKKMKVENGSDHTAEHSHKCDASFCDADGAEST